MLRHEVVARKSQPGVGAVGTMSTSGNYPRRRRRWPSVMRDC